MDKPTGEIAQHPLGLIGIVELPSLPERPAYRRMQRRGQPLDVAGFMNLAALDGCVGTEGATDNFAQRFGAISSKTSARSRPSIQPRQAGQRTKCSASSLDVPPTRLPMYVPRESSVIRYARLYAPSKPGFSRAVVCVIYATLRNYC